METKYCPSCGTHKAVSEFGKNRARRDGLCHYCKPCDALRNRRYASGNREKLADKDRRYYIANRERELRQNQQYRATPSGRASGLAHESRRRAAKRGSQPTLCATERDLIKGVYSDVPVVELLLGEPCHVDHVVPLSKGGRHEYANLQVLTKRENLSKGARTDWQPSPGTFHRVAYAVQRGAAA